MFNFAASPSRFEYLLDVIHVVLLDDQLKLGFLEPSFYLLISQVFDRVRHRTDGESIFDNKNLFRPACNISLFKYLTSFTDSHLLTYIKLPF